MATLEDLKPSITILEPAEQIELIRTLRASRRTPKIPEKKTKSIRTPKPKKQQTFKQLWDLMSPSEQAQLRAQLSGD